MRTRRKKKTNIWKAGTWRSHPQTQIALLITASITGSMVSMFRPNEVNPLMTAMQSGPAYITRGWPLGYIDCFGGGACVFNQIGFIQNLILWFVGLTLLWLLFLGIYRLFDNAPKT